MRTLVVAMLRTLLALATTLVLVAPAGAAQAPPCHRTAVTPRVVATRMTTTSGRAAIVACDRAHGRLATLRRGYAGDAPKGFPVLGAPVVQGTRVVWSELAGSRAHLRQDLRTADVRHPARRSRRRIGPLPSAGGLAIASGPLLVFALPRRALAYVVYGGPRYARPSALVLRRRDRPLRVVTRSLFHAPHVEDGRTLVWEDDDGYRSLDLAPLPRDASGCPIRSAYRAAVALDTPRLRVTSWADSDLVLEAETAVRVCWKATGRDDIAATLPQGDMVAAPVVTHGEFVALTTAGSDSSNGCAARGLSGPVGVWVVDFRRRRTATGHLDGGCAVVQTLALDPTGVPAWLISDEQGARIEVPGGDNRPDTVVDSGPAGSLATLAASPSGGFTWTHDGAVRSWSARP